MLLEFSEAGVVLLSQEWVWLDIIRILVSTFLAAIYLQSSIDKIIDRQGNLDFMAEHFASTPLAVYSTTRPHKQRDWAKYTS